MEKAGFLKSLEQARKKAEAKLTGKVSSLERILEISHQISVLDIEEALDLILNHLVDLTQTRRGMVMLLDKKNQLKFEHGLNMNVQEVESLEFQFSRTITEKAISENKVIVVEDVPTSDIRFQESIVQLGLTALMAIPLQVREKVIGVLYVDTNEISHEVSWQDTSIFSAFGGQAAIAIEHARLHQKMKEDYLFLKEPNRQSSRFSTMVYQSRAMERILKSIEQVLDNDIPVLVQGESGTGKELVANAVHFQGKRRNHKFVAQNTGALPDTLLESELFGHRRGAFSGAVTDKVGLFELADGGTVFLDEIGEASPAMQVRLLRFLETRKFRRIGDTVERTSNVRIVTATHRDLKQEVALGNFRQDLYYRLSVFPIYLPALRERREDIPLLVDHFVEDFNAILGKSIHIISKKAMERFQSKDWPGNIRELKNVVYRLMVLSPGDELIWREEENYVAEETPTVEEDFELDSLKTLEEMERDYIRFVLKKVGGNQSQAAK